MHQHLNDLGGVVIHNTNKLAETNQYMKELIEATNRRIDELTESTNRRINELTESNNRQFDELTATNNRRFDELTKLIAEKFDAQADDLSVLKGAVKTLHKLDFAMEKDTGLFPKSFKHIAAAITRLHDDLKSHVNWARKTGKDQTAMMKQLDTLESAVESTVELTVERTLETTLENFFNEIKVFHHEHVSEGKAVMNDILLDARQSFNTALNERLAELCDAASHLQEHVKRSKIGSVKVMEDVNTSLGHIHEVGIMILQIMQQDPQGFAHGTSETKTRQASPPDATSGIEEIQTDASAGMYYYTLIASPSLITCVRLRSLLHTVNLDAEEVSRQSQQDLPHTGNLDAEEASGKGQEDLHIREETLHGELQARKSW